MRDIPDEWSGIFFVSFKNVIFFKVNSSFSKKVLERTGSYFEK